jgi:hypothetical protein
VNHLKIKNTGKKISAGSFARRDLTLILLKWSIGWAPNNASKWQMGFNSAFKGLKEKQTKLPNPRVLVLSLVYDSDGIYVFCVALTAEWALNAKLENTWKE